MKKISRDHCDWVKQSTVSVNTIFRILMEINITSYFMPFKDQPSDGSMLNDQS